MARKKTSVQKLLDLGVPLGMANRLYYLYGAEANLLIEENPYRLIELDEYSAWKTAERIARSSGMQEDDERRVAGSMLHTLHQATTEGHVYLGRNQFNKRVTQLMEGVDALSLETGLNALLEEESVVDDPHPESSEERLYSARMHQAESEAARLLITLMQAPSSMGLQSATREEMQQVEEQLGIRLARQQEASIRAAVEHKALIITGGPGTGKTTVLRSVMQLFRLRHASIKLAAPTGRASRRLSDSTGKPASTLHRLLEYNLETQRFNRDASNPLRCDVLIVDEASMIDIELLWYVLRALRPSTHIVLVGDVDQLPSVGPGHVLHDLIETGLIPTIRLTEIFRQREGSLISENAGKIRDGIMPDIEGMGLESGQDFFFIKRSRIEDIQNLLLDLVKERIPRQFGFDPVSQIQVLTPMNRKELGVATLNEMLQNNLNPAPQRFGASQYGVSLGDKVMQLRNDYAREVFNGDIGYVTRIDPRGMKVTINFYGRDVEYEWLDLDSTSLAYAMTVHKSQGGEYPAVVIPIHRQHYMLLQRNLLYTAVSRGKGLVILVGDPRALEIAVQNNKISSRNSGLQQRLMTMHASG